MNITPYFSIIIPVYNGVRNNIDRCLNSIWMQNIDSHLYEIICIDDCSSDNSREWLSAETQKHDNLVVIENEKNIRQGGSRNKGIKRAKGKYLLFIDQDDYYHPNCLQLIYNHLQKNDLDILIVSNTWELEGKPSDKIQGIRPNTEILSGTRFLEENGPVFVPWKFIFKKDIVINNNLYLRENVKLGEDIDWTFKMLFKAQKVQYQPIILVHYIRGTSNTSNETNRLQILLSCISIYELISTNQCSQKVRNIASNAICYFAKSTLINMLFFNGLQEKQRMLHLFKKQTGLKFSPFINAILKHIKLYAFLSDITAIILKFIMPLWRKFQMKFIWPKIMY
mgnify:CR=1 FL=1|jgi:glycosyltransferase involved in cell wall biosynthesis